MGLSKYILGFVFLITGFLKAQVTEIVIPRIEQMPKVPVPFSIRDWKVVAGKYDSFIYNENKSGLYLPLIHVEPNGINYPQNKGFGLHTYVGTNSPNGYESINVLPSLVGASLVGIDKSNQFGRNWVLMSQDFFNKNNGELIYLNNKSGISGDDWWYDVMPNVYFYQLYDLYPGIGGDAEFQFKSVADRFLGSVRNLGGNDTPWQKANMNYRAYNFKTGQGNAAGVKEPEAAGAYAWLLYNAYIKSGDKSYLEGAEWSMEFLNELTSNPSYELQLPYGTYTAARMNAELGTNYDIEKMINWSFNKGPLRGWGTIVGTWGGIDVSGVVGEANDQGNDYAFQMNGLQQAAMLVPLVRYDKRFASAIGKWILNLANATRLFYPGFLPNSLQDSYAWSNAYDPDKVVGYEALREKWMNMSPFSTGDAIKGGWANTNLALYGTSSIGYLGALIEKTDFAQILKIDLLKTDFFNQAAYPTYLYYNPFNIVHTVKLDVGNIPVDIYNGMTEGFLLQNVTGEITLAVPAYQSLLITLAPAGGTITYDRNKMLIDGVVVDYNQTKQAFKYEPRIQALAADQINVEFNDSTTIYSKVFDKDSNKFTRTWSTTGGNISGSGDNIQWIAPAVEGQFEVKLIITDESNNADTATLIVNSVAVINVAPEILKIQKSAEYTVPNGSIQLTCNAIDKNGDPLNYVWSTTGGTITGSGQTVNWTAENVEGIYQIQVKVSDDKGLTTTGTTHILVKVFSQVKGNLIAYYPFASNADDHSGNQLHGVINGPLIVDDLWGNHFHAALFDGVNDRVTVTNKPILNFTDAITVSGWFRPGILADHETFITSHGSWQNRWKVSVTPDQKIRWTLNSLNTIGDLDSETSIEKDSAYFFTASYDGSLLALYLNGVLHTYKPLTGKIRTSPVELLMGQMLPDNIEYNFKGLIDEVKIMDYALTPEEVEKLYKESVVATHEFTNIPKSLVIYPNPVSDVLTIQLSPDDYHSGLISIYTMDGNLIKEKKIEYTSAIQLDVKDLKEGIYTLVLKSESIYSRTIFIKI